MILGFIILEANVDHMYSQYLSEYIDQSIPTAIGWIEQSLVLDRHNINNSRDKYSITLVVD